MDAEVQQMHKDNFVKMLRHVKVLGYIGRKIELDYFNDYKFGYSQQFYICRKNDFVESIIG